MKWSGHSIVTIQEKLEPYMALIIQKSHPDLLPYAFQVQAFFIKLTNSLSVTNQNLISSVLPLDNWEAGSRYYLPTLVIFIENVLSTNSSALATNIPQLCAIAHRLFTLGLDGQAFSLLTVLIEIYPFEAIASFLHQSYLIMFTKLHNSKNQNIRLSTKFHRGAILLISAGILKNGWKVIAESMNSVQNGIFFMLIKGVILQNLRSIETIIERRAVTLALTTLLNNLEIGQEIWNLIVVNLCKIMENNTNTLSGTIYSHGLIDLPEENTIQITRDSFQKIYSAEVPLIDKYAHLPNEKQVFMHTICNLQYPGGSLSSFLGNVDAKVVTILTGYANSLGLHLN